MCGITGAVWTDSSQAIDAALLQRMTGVLTHRGPDDAGTFTSAVHMEAPYPMTPGVALGFRRLSIIDLTGSHQPMANEDGSIWIVFNGEIYNFRDLRRRLEGNGHCFSTNGDTETIIHLYEDEDLGFLNHLVGMFALAIWDRNKRRLILARDRLGQKPLVYYQDANRLFFSSELKSLLQVPDIPRDIDPNAIDEYLLYQYIPYPNTIFRGIRKLPPAHYGIYQDGRLSMEPYWVPDLNEEVARPPGEYPKRLRELATESVRLRLQSDVPLGVFLSGGMDSSIVAALAQKISDEPIKTFSIGFPIKEYDESAAARQVAESLGTDHLTLRVDPDCINMLPKLVWFFDEPFGDSSAIPTYYLARLARDYVTVALSGDGGDELFAGYRRYRAVRLADWFDRLPSPIRHVATSRFWQWIPSSPRQHSRVRMFKRFLEALSLSSGPRYADWVGVFKQHQRGILYSDAFIEMLSDQDPLDFFKARFRHVSHRDAVTTVSLVDMASYLPCDICHKVDIASMANSLECRQPFLDHRIVEEAIRMPIHEKLHGIRAKWVLREAFGNLVPRGVFRRPKRGFGVPLDDWFRNELKSFTHDMLLDPTSLARGYFREEAVRNLIREHTEGIFNHAQRLWMLLVLELWHREWIDSS
ncbi:MAG: asparagine synthase (glutamine-hydrolyzing) [Pirellulales bacterium]|nr:asparagine synthase (glutamine-hydrolyzing) [Pirellulales bacterium]